MAFINASRLFGPFSAGASPFEARFWKTGRSLFCMPFTVTEPVITSCRDLDPESRVKSHIFLSFKAF